VFATVAGDDDVAGLRADPGGPSRDQVGVAGVATEPLEPVRQRQSVALGDASGATDVPPGEARMAVAFLEIAVGAFDEDREDASEYYEDGTENRPLTCTLVLVDGEWSLWRVRGLGRFGR